MEILKLDMFNVMCAYAVFALAFGANILFSLYFNIKVIGAVFDKERLLDSLKKAFIFILATFALVIAVDLAMMYFAKYIPDIKDTFTDTVTILMIVSTIGRAALKYIVEAYHTFVNVLNSDTKSINKKM